MSYQNFKSDYIQFNSFDEKDSAELSKALDVFINSFDNGEYVFKERDIENSQHLKSIYIKKDECFCYFNEKKNALNVVMKFPCFDRLSRNATNNRNIQERLDYLGFLISRYVTRAFMLNIILSLSLAANFAITACFFRSKRRTCFRFKRREKFPFLIFKISLKTA